MKLTPPQKRALQAVRDGLVYRRYHATGNTLHGPKGVGAGALWRLAEKGLIEDGRGNGRDYTLVLTRAGREACNIS